MRAGQWKIGIGVVKLCRRPGIGVMALRTIVAEIVLDMIRVCSIGIICFMTGPAVRRCIGVSLGMAFNAIERSMRAGQWEIGIGVVKLCRGPGAGVVALRAIVAEIIPHVIGIRCTCKVRLVAGPAIRRQILVLPVNMTGFALQGKMRAG